MPLPALLAPVMIELAKNGLGMLASAVQAKGKEVIEEKLGVEIPSNVEQLTPDKVAELQIAQASHAEFLVKAYLEDRQDARERDIKLRELTGGKNLRADLMVILDVIGIIVCLLVLTWYRDKIPGEVVGLLGAIVGIFGAGLRDAHQFEFGSSRGSKEKDNAMMKWVDET